jgi:hypothetical protein
MQNTKTCIMIFYNTFLNTKRAEKFPHIKYNVSTALFNATEKDLYSFTPIVVILQTASFAINVWIPQSIKQGVCIVYPTPTGCGLTW